jgi:polyhydroxyalkanoate synthesis regulator phasin
MGKKLTVANGQVNNTPMKKQVGKVIKQAKQSMKILETLEKETMAKAKSFASLASAIPGTGSDAAKKMTNDKIISSLRKLGVPTQAEVDALRARIEKLEAELALKD